MGIRDLLTKDIKLTSALMTWREPVLFRVRLRNDLVIRLLMVLGAWLASTGLLLILFAFSANPGGVSLALGLGLIGAGIGLVLVLGRKGHASGSCWLYQDKITWQSTSTGFFTLHWNMAEFDYEEIDRCVIFPAKHLGKPFSAMLIEAYDDPILLGIPKQIDLIQVAKVFSARNVDVSTAQQVPGEYTANIPLPLGVAVPVVGLVLLIAGFVVVGPSPDREDHREIARPEIPGIDVNPGGVVVIERPAASQNNATASVDRTEPDAEVEVIDPLENVPFPRKFGFRPPAPLVPETTPRTSQPQVPATRPDSPAAADNKSTDSELLGGAGGGPFRVVSAQGQPVLAVQYSLGQWAGKERVGRLIPPFQRPPATPAEMLIVAREGYALGAIQVDAGNLVDAIQLVFMRIRDGGSLDEQDSYTSDWIGTPNEDTVRTISGNGAPVVGFHGRGAAVLDAVGLVFGSASR